MASNVLQDTPKHVLIKNYLLFAGLLFCILTSAYFSGKVTVFQGTPIWIMYVFFNFFQLPENLVYQLNDRKTMVYVNIFVFYAVSQGFILNELYYSMKMMDMSHTTVMTISNLNNTDDSEVMSLKNSTQSMMDSQSWTIFCNEHRNVIIQDLIVSIFACLVWAGVFKIMCGKVHWKQNDLWGIVLWVVKTCLVLRLILPLILKKYFDYSLFEIVTSVGISSLRLLYIYYRLTRITAKNDNDREFQAFVEIAPNLMVFVSDIIRLLLKNMLEYGDVLKPNQKANVSQENQASLSESAEN